MYQVSDFNKNAYRVNEIAKILGVTTKTIRNYDKEGKIKTYRTEGNHRMVLKSDLIAFLKNKGLIVDNTGNKKRDIIYVRVSNQAQKKDGDLDRQALFLIENVSDLVNPLILKEVSSELNDKRPNFQKLLTMACNNEVRNVYVTDKDKLTKFGLPYLEIVFLAHNVNIIALKDEHLDKSV